MFEKRIRNLKTKVALLYPREGSDKHWKDEFLNQAKGARYDEYTGLVKMHIADVTIMPEIRNVLELTGGMTNTSLIQNHFPVHSGYS